jgi:hypothetical protein
MNVQAPGAKCTLPSFAVSARVEFGDRGVGADRLLDGRGGFRTGKRRGPSGIETEYLKAGTAANRRVRIGYLQLSNKI